MLLGDLKLPSVSAEGLSSQQGVHQVLEYMVQLNKKLQFVLQNLDTENMSTEMAKTLEDVQAAGKEIENKVSNEEFSSVMKQTADAIALRVQKNEVVSAINLSPEEIKIQAGKISLEGLVTVNGYFSIDLDGKVTATGGSIAGWTLDSGALYTGSNTGEVAPSLYLGTKNIAKATAIAASAERKDWRIKIGASFGVTSDGTVYAQNGVFRGNVSAGKIEYGVNASTGVNYGTFSGGGITVRTIAADKLDTIYATSAEFNSLKATVADIERLFLGYGSIDTLNISNALVVKGVGAGWINKTISGVSCKYLGNW